MVEDDLNLDLILKNIFLLLCYVVFKKGFKYILYSLVLLM